jgi:hypothetical protein
MRQGILDNQRVEGLFKHSFWDKVIREMVNAGYPRPDRNIFNSKRNGLLKKWRVFDRLVNTQGWWWDEATSLLMTSDETWDAEIALKREVKWFRKNRWTNKSLLDEIFIPDLAAQRYAQGHPPITSPPPQVNHEDLAFVRELTRAAVPKRPLPMEPMTFTPNKRQREDHLVREASITNATPPPGNDKARAIQLLSLEFEHLGAREFNIAVDIVEEHATTFVYLSKKRREEWLSAKIGRVLYQS